MADHAWERGSSFQDFDPRSGTSSEYTSWTCSECTSTVNVEGGGSPRESPFWPCTKSYASMSAVKVPPQR